MVNVVCTCCNKKFGNRKIKDHVSECVKNTVTEESGYLMEFMAYNDITNTFHYMHALFGSKCKLSHIDKFLRDMWCECCGHMSIVHVFDAETDIRKDGKFRDLISKYDETNQFTYEYDMGDTTTIFFRILKKLNDNNSTKYKLLYRNEQQNVKCDNYTKCKTFASHIFYRDRHILYCKDCLDDIVTKLKKQNEDFDESNIMKQAITNSPRSGVLCYNHFEYNENNN